MPRANPLRIWFMEREPVEIRITPAVHVAAETEFNTPLQKMDRMKQYYYMAWLAATKQKKYDGDFEQFLEDALDIEEVTAPDGPDSLDPTAEDQSRGSS